MVTTARRPVEYVQTQEAAPQSAPGVASGSRRRDACPRCGDRLFVGYHEPECLQCGWVDYTYQEPVKEQESILGTARHFILRYVGEFPALSETLAYIEVIRQQNRAVYRVACPFCTKPMEQTSQSGKRREGREQRYECGLGHRLSLMHAGGGSPGWK